MSKHEKIVTAARERFHYYGIAKTTMQEIAADAGVAVGTLYLYFRNKDDLVVACADDFVAAHRRLAEELLSSDRPADELLRRYVVARFRTAAEIRTVSRHAAELTRAVLRLKPDRLIEEGQMMWDVVTRILELGIRQKRFAVADPQADAKIFLFAVACFFPNALGEPIVPPVEADLLSVVDWFLGVWVRSPKSSRSKSSKRQAARVYGSRLSKSHARSPRDS